MARRVSQPASPAAEAAIVTDQNAPVFDRIEEPDPTASSVEGGLLALTRDGIIGWGWDRQAASQPLHVVLLANEIPIGVGLCDRFDLDMVRSRIGPGIPGFVIPWYRKVADDTLIRLTLRDVHGKFLGSPIMIEPDAQAGVGLESPDEQYEGSIDGLRDGVLLGWARNVMMPNHAVTVELYDGNDRLARQAARGFRNDLKIANKNNGNCAFEFDIPLSLIDDQIHSLRVIVAGTQFELTNSPLQFGRLAASTLIDEVVQMRQQMIQLRARVDHIVAPNGKVQSEIIQTMSERIAAFAEVQRDLVEQELSALRKLSFGASDAGVIRERVQPNPMSRNLPNAKNATRR